MDPSPDGAPPDSSLVEEGAGRQAADAGARPGETRMGGLPGVSAAFSQGILDSITDGVVVADKEGRFLHFNRAAKRILGIGAVEVPPSEWTKTYGCFLEDGITPFPPEELPLARAIRGETVQDCQLFIRNPHLPQGVWLSVNSGPLRDEAGGVCGGVIVFRDITARKENLHRVQLLSAAVEQTADSVVITDRDGVIEYVNPAAERTSGFSKAELIGRTPRLFRSGFHTEDFYARLWTTLREGRVYRGAIVNRKKNGDLYHCEQTITPIQDSGGGVVRFVSVGKDVTELKKAAERETKLILARSVQQRLYPAAPPEACGLEIAGNAFMAYETGGDYFDFISLRNGCLCVVVGDVSGHAFDAALIMAQTRAYLRSIVQIEPDPGKILSLVNRVLVAELADNHFVTLLLTCYHAPSQTLRYASAGHTTGYILDTDGAVKRELSSTGMPLGITQDATFESSAAISVEEGDLISLFTDGVTETEAPDGMPFGQDRALEVIRACRGERSATIVNRLYRAIREFADRRPQTDDITAVVCKVAHSAER
jgi:PAS domain S-box-containing protein